MAAVTKRWRKWVAATCSHGADIDPKAREAFLAFLDRYKPDQRIHLGDAIDLACLRAGARRDPDDPDRAESLMDDLLAGLSFLHEMRPTMYFHGNHEQRAVTLAHSANQVVAYAAGAVMAKIHDGLAKYKTEIVPYRGMARGSVRYLGGTAFLHGALFNVSAARDTAETIGAHCVFGHTHRVAMEPARVHADAIGYNIGCLARLDMEYAAGRRQTLAWRHGFAYGEYSDTACTVNLVTLSPHYRLPL
jgi:predicted phosphodiesterase